MTLDMAQAARLPRDNAGESCPSAIHAIAEHDETPAWADRCAHWQREVKRNAPSRKKRERCKSPLILCGHGLSIRMDKGALYIRDGNTHYPSERREWRFFKGHLDIPPRLVVIDGSGSITFDALEWMTSQQVSLIRVKWDGSIPTAMTATGYAADPAKVQWQRKQADNPKARVTFAKRIVSRKLQASIKTLRDCIPPSGRRDRALDIAHAALAQIRDGKLKSIADVLGIEGPAAAAYFAAWAGLPVKWKGLNRHPVPKEWHAFTSRASLATGIKAKNRNASHPVNAMLNYAYGVLQGQLQVETIADGYDPTLGVVHKPYRGRPSYVLDLMEPMRPVVDAALLLFIERETFTVRDFVIRDDGVCRLNPELARRVVQVVTFALLIPNWQG